MADTDSQGKLSQRALDRRKRQTEALRANLRRRKLPDAPAPAPEPDESEHD